jgi:hypothetical protein
MVLNKKCYTFIIRMKKSENKCISTFFVGLNMSLQFTDVIFTIERF